MTEPMSQRKGVVIPGPIHDRKRVNEQLLKIKEELLNTKHEANSDNELSFEYSQPIRPQRFYADIDAHLDSLNRGQYTKKVRQICHNTYANLLDYRERLGKRAQALPNCPKLVSSTDVTRQQKLEKRNVQMTATYLMRFTMEFIAETFWTCLQTQQRQKTQ